MMTFPLWHTQFHNIVSNLPFEYSEKVQRSATMYVNKERRKGKIAAVEFKLRKLSLEGLYSIWKHHCTKTKSTL
jgi:GH15 family glucan-1,4-alpha-glucosidase